MSVRNEALPPRTDASVQPSRRIFDGLLRDGGRDVGVRLRLASRYSVWLEFPEAHSGAREGVFERLCVELKTRTVEMGPCRVLREGPVDQGGYRLVPMASIHDFEKLLFHSRANMLDLAARHVPLTLRYKKHVKPAFREYVADVAYDLSIYRHLFDRLDREYAQEEPHVRNIIQQGIIDSIGDDFTRCLDVHVARLEEIVAGYSDVEHSHHGFYLRKQLWDKLLCAPFMMRTNVKPRGYIGDSEMMQMCYRHTYEGDCTFGKLLHMHPVSSTAAQAVRNRRTLLAALAADHARRINATPERRMRLLSVACGPAFELHDLLRSREDCERIHCSLLDQDQLALGEASAVINDIETRLGTGISADLLNESVRTLLVTSTLREQWGDFDFIYSMGLFDYLSPPVAEAVLKKLHRLLAPGGELTVGNFHARNPTRRYMDYWLDWPLIYRTEADFEQLAQQLDNVEAWIEFDDTGVQMLLRIRKKPN